MTAVSCHTEGGEDGCVTKLVKSIWDENFHYKQIKKFQI